MLESDYFTKYDNVCHWFRYEWRFRNLSDTMKGIGLKGYYFETILVKLVMHHSSKVMNNAPLDTSTLKIMNKSDTFLFFTSSNDNVWKLLQGFFCSFLCRLRFRCMRNYQIVDLLFHFPFRKTERLAIGNGFIVGQKY